MSLLEGVSFNESFAPELIKLGGLYKEAALGDLLQTIKRHKLGAFLGVVLLHDHETRPNGLVSEIHGNDHSGAFNTISYPDSAPAQILPTQWAFSAKDNAMVVTQFLDPRSEQSVIDSFLRVVEILNSHPHLEALLDDVRSILVAHDAADSFGIGILRSAIYPNHGQKWLEIHLDDENVQIARPLKTTETLRCSHQVLKYESNATLYCRCSIQDIGEVTIPTMWEI